MGLVGHGKYRLRVPEWKNHAFEAPCEHACPAGIPTQLRYNLLRSGKAEEAFREVLDYTPFPGCVCGTVCPNLCMQACTRGKLDFPVLIGPLGLESQDITLPKPAVKTGKKVAVIGGGNTAIDAMRYTVKPDFVFPTALLNELDFRNHRIIAVTCHRRENYGKPMEAIMHAILEIVQTHPDVEVVYPVHLSPVVRECVFPILGGHDRIHLIDPVDVEEMHNLIARCYMVMTDSGGLQEEAPALAWKRTRSSGSQASCWTIPPRMRVWQRPSTPTATAMRANASCRRFCGTLAAQRKSPPILTPD